MGRILVGCCGFGDNRRRYTRRLPLVEVQETFFMPPRVATLRRWRSEAPGHFVFCMRAWQLITHEPTRGRYPRLSKSLELDLGGGGHFRDSDTVHAAMATTLEAARALEVEAIVFETPASFTPTPASQKALTRFFETVARDERARYVWHPRGLWSAKKVHDICADLGIIGSAPLDEHASDGDYLYGRLEAASYSDEALVRLGDAAADSEHARLVFNTAHMVRDALRLRSLLGDVVETLDDVDDDDDDDDFDGDEAR